MIHRIAVAACNEAIRIIRKCKEITMILSVSNITKSFGTDVILSEVSFHIEAGQKAAIVGINGAGKSTLLKIITGELAPDPKSF